MSNDFSEEEIASAKYLISIIIREIWIKATLKYHLTQAKMAPIQKFYNKCCKWYWERRKNHLLLLGSTTWYNPEISMRTLSASVELINDKLRVTSNASQGNKLKNTFPWHSINGSISNLYIQKPILSLICISQNTK